MNKTRHFLPASLSAACVAYKTATADLERQTDTEARGGERRSYRDARSPRLPRALLERHLHGTVMTLTVPSRATSGGLPSPVFALCSTL